MYIIEIISVIKLYNNLYESHHVNNVKSYK